MQIPRQESVRNSYFPPSYYKIQSVKIFIRSFFTVACAVLFLNCTSGAQIKPLNDVRTFVKRANIAIGSPIDNEATRHVLAKIDEIPGLTSVIQGYNAKYGNDSVHALRFVDREPDEKADDPLVRDYYNVIVIEDSANHTSLWYTFVVKKDLNEIKYYDITKSKTRDLPYWKKLWPATEFLKSEE